MEMLPAHPSIVAASVHRCWTPSWEKVVEKATVLERLQLAEMNLVLGLILPKDIFSSFARFDAEEAKSNKLAEDLKAMGLEKKRVEEAQKLAEEAQKLAEDRTLVAEASLATANSSLEATVGDNERSLATVKIKLEKVRAERVDAEAKVVEAYQDAFVDTPEYQDLVQCLMTVGGEQLVERIMDAHPEWDLSFLCEAPAKAHTSEANSGDTRIGDEGPSCVALKEAAGQLN
ncbi:hypothetical protein Adt_39473 [Abeliophyllum distichum]|uniref:Uncharacterized protein n=1 Tax=Abeliophyllum distichum TaxID=126358 RepID=A0ABD1Q686_9LAMI